MHTNLCKVGGDWAIESFVEDGDKQVKTFGSRKEAEEWRRGVGQGTVGVPEPKRARNEDGEYVGDDPSTPDVNEAYESGKKPKKKAKPKPKPKAKAKKK